MPPPKGRGGSGYPPPRPLYNFSGIIPHEKIKPPKLPAYVPLVTRLSRISLLQKLGMFAVAGMGTIYMTYSLSNGTAGNSCMPGCPPLPCPCPDLCKKEVEFDNLRKGCSCSLNPCGCYPPK